MAQIPLEGGRLANPLVLLVGDKATSADSLVAWLCLRKGGVQFIERQLAAVPGAPTDAAEWSPSGALPVLVHDGEPIWDALAIAEYVNEQFCDGKLWPSVTRDRGEARSLACEVHAGLTQLRRVLPMNCKLRNASLPDAPEIDPEIVRIAGAWRHALGRSRGPWLFGQFSIVDAMFAPFVFCLHSHDVRVGDVEHGYQRHVLSDSDVHVWLAEAVR